MEQKSNMWVIALVIITAVVVGGGVYWWQQNKVQKEVFGVTVDTVETTTADKKEPKEPLSYSTSSVSASVSQEITSLDYTAEITTADKKEPNEPLSYSTGDVPVFVSKEIVPFDYTADQLASMAQECGNEQSESYFSNLVSKFSGATKIVYKFKYTGVSQDSDTFVVTLLPNKAGYSSLDEFTKDFDLCYAGGDAYPAMLNDDWLLFASACGTGFSDGSGRPIGCDEVQEVVLPTLKLN